MKLITKWLFAQLACWHVLALVSLTVLPLLGWTVESQAGWLTCPPRWGDLPAAPVRRRKKRTLPLCHRLNVLWWYVRRSWRQPLLRSVALGTLWWLSGGRGSVLIVCGPWVLWLWQGAAAGCPVVARTAHTIRGLSVFGAAPGQVCGRSGVCRRQTSRLANAWCVWPNVRARRPLGGRDARRGGRLPGDVMRSFHRPCIGGRPSARAAADAVSAAVGRARPRAG